MAIRSTLRSALLASVLATLAATLCAQTLDPQHEVGAVAPGDFPAVGRSYDVDFGVQKFRLDYLSETQMKFTSPDGKNVALVPIVVTKVRPGLFMVYWSRRAGQHVVHVEDFDNNVVYSNIVLPDGTIQRLKGTLVPAK